MVYHSSTDLTFSLFLIPTFFIGLLMRKKTRRITCAECFYLLSKSRNYGNVTLPIGL